MPFLLWVFRGVNFAGIVSFPRNAARLIVSWKVCLQLNPASGWMHLFVMSENLFPRFETTFRRFLRLFIFGDNIWAQEKCCKHFISTEECTTDRWNHDKKSHYKACGGEICFRKDVFVPWLSIFPCWKKANYCWRKCIMDVWKGIEVCRGVVGAICLKSR